MAEKSNPLIGLVVNLPESTEAGVVVDFSKIRGNLYKATILGKVNIYVAKFHLNAPEVNEPVEYVDWNCYDIENIQNCL